jgi:hypothetical protein
MTSNLEHEIDAAVESRLTGWVKYKSPNTQRAVRAWKRGLNNSNSAFSEDEINDHAIYLSEKYRLDFRTVNRTVRNAGTLAKARGVLLSIDLIEKLLAFKGEEALIA